MIGQAGTRVSRLADVAASGPWPDGFRSMKIDTSDQEEHEGKTCEDQARARRGRTTVPSWKHWRASSRTTDMRSRKPLDGREALNRLAGDLAPDVILLDLRMPVMDGWSFRNVQRKSSLFAHIPRGCYVGGRHVASTGNLG